MMRARFGSGTVCMSIGFAALLGACTQEAQPPVATVPTKNLGRTCADNAINCSYKATEHRPKNGSLANVAGAREIDRKQGAVPPPDSLDPLVKVNIVSLVPQQQRWMMTVAVTSGAPQRTIDATIACDFTNAGQAVAAATHTAPSLVPGQSAAVQIAGPAVTETYVDGATCRVVSPLL